MLISDLEVDGRKNFNKSCRYLTRKSRAVLTGRPSKSRMKETTLAVAITLTFHILLALSLFKLISNIHFQHKIAIPSLVKRLHFISLCSVTVRLLFSSSIQVTLFSIVVMHIVCNVLRIFLGILVVSSIGEIILSYRRFSQEYH